jgi:tetratricopeptide (TPR) repeat protein
VRTHLKFFFRKILDRLTYNLMLARVHIAINKKTEAIPFIQELLALNQDNKDYFLLLKQAENLENESQELEFYQKYCEKYPNSAPLKVMQLHFLKEEAFKASFQNFLNGFITKCQPSAFSEIRAFYKDSKKREIIEGVLIENEKNFKEDEKSIPTNLLWSLMLLAQHYDYVGNHQRALEYIEKAIEHTPTLIELYLIKAKIYKHLRDYEKADNFANHVKNSLMMNLLIKI